MKSWSAGLYGVSCVLLSDVTAGKYDAQLKAQAAFVKAVPGAIGLRLFYEMTDSQSEACANPTKSGPVFIAAWQHVVGVFRAAGATNAKWVWAPGRPAYDNNKELTFYPGSAWVDVVGEDVYNMTTAPEPFAAAVCTVGPSLGKPFAITETGAVGVTNQLAWLANVKTACPALSAFVYWDAVGSTQSFAITNPSVFEALKAVGTP
jgi:beta-mannanase